MKTLTFQRSKLVPMKKNLLLALPLALLVTNAQAQQRYLEEVFTSDEVVITNDIVFGTNVDFLTSDFEDEQAAGADLIQLHTAIATGNEIPAAFFDPNDGSTVVKVTNLKMDVYQPDPSVDSETARPVFVYVHTGNVLPPPLNGSPLGTRKDSSATEICKQMARRGYVAVSMSYRGGWNPLGTTLEIRRSTLLNGIYRAIHDVKQCVRTLKADAADANTYAIDPNKVILYGEGTGGYITLATVTLDRPEELYIDKFLPDPFEPDVSYVDTNLVGNLDGFNGAVTLYKPNGYDSKVHFCVNAGGALADTSWIAEGDVPMVALQTVFDPFAPFGAGIVIVPTTGEQVVDVHGSNVFMPLVNQLGNNDSFRTLPNGDILTDRARSLYDTDQTHGSNTVHISADAEGLYPFVTPNWPAQIEGALEESGPWQWWDPDSPIANVEVAPGVTTGMASQASNPNFGPDKGRTYIDTIMGYMNPRIVCALELGPCSLVGIDEADPISMGVNVYPNPMKDQVMITSNLATIRMAEVYDINGRRVHAQNVENNGFTLYRNGLKAGAYFVTLTFDQGTVTRKLILD